MLVEDWDSILRWFLAPPGHIEKKNKKKHKLVRMCSQENSTWEPQCPVGLSKWDVKTRTPFLMETSYVIVYSNWAPSIIIGYSKTELMATPPTNWSGCTLKEMQLGSLTVLYRSVFCINQYQTVPFCLNQYQTVPFCIKLYRSVSNCTVLSCIPSNRLLGCRQCKSPPIHGPNIFSEVCWSRHKIWCYTQSKDWTGVCL